MVVVRPIRCHVAAAVIIFEIPKCNEWKDVEHDKEQSEDWNQCYFVFGKDAHNIRKHLDLEHDINHQERVHEHASAVWEVGVNWENKVSCVSQMALSIVIKRLNEHRHLFNNQVTNFENETLIGEISQGFDTEVVVLIT